MVQCDTQNVGNIQGLLSSCSIECVSDQQLATAIPIALKAFSHAKIYVLWCGHDLLKYSWCSKLTRFCIAITSHDIVKFFVVSVAVVLGQSECASPQMDRCSCLDSGAHFCIVEYDGEESFKEESNYFFLIFVAIKPFITNILLLCNSFPFNF